MNARQGGQEFKLRGVWVACAAAACVLTLAPEAKAEGFFESLFGLSEERPAPAARVAARARPQSSDERYRATDWFAPQAPASTSSSASRRKQTATAPRARMLAAKQRRPKADENAPVRETANRERHASSSTGSGAFCVRLCDGRYFPLSQAVSADGDDAVSTCNALCPAAKTKVFSGSEPENARASDGARYRELPAAFAFRDRIVPECSCTGHGSGGLATMKLEADPTLQSGDITATSAGLMMFKGANRFPYKSADFTPVGSYAKLSGDLRRTLEGVKVDQTALAMPVTVPVVAATEDPATTKKAGGRRTRQEASLD